MLAGKTWEGFLASQIHLYCWRPALAPAEEMEREEDAKNTPGELPPCHERKSQSFLLLVPYPGIRFEFWLWQDTTRIPVTDNTGPTGQHSQAAHHPAKCKLVQSSSRSFVRFVQTPKCLFEQNSFSSSLRSIPCEATSTPHLLIVGH